jgi:hypothetical protein
MHTLKYIHYSCIKNYIFKISFIPSKKKDTKLFHSYFGFLYFYWLSEIQKIMPEARSEFNKNQRGRASVAEWLRRIVAKQ